MQTTTAHPLGNGVTATLTYQAIRNEAGYPLAMPGAVVHYRLTDGSHVIQGDDMSAPWGFRSTAEDLVRALCSFLANDLEHAESHDRGQWGDPCAEYGAGCPSLRREYLAELEQMSEAIDAASWIG